jgi:hypothetical protein
MKLLSAMKTRTSLLVLLAATCAAVTAKVIPPGVTGDYLEVRTCDVYTGPCFANAEMGLTGKESILVWNIRSGGWAGTSLDGLSVIAVVKADGTLGDQRYRPQSGRAVLIVDERADGRQRTALAGFARSMAEGLIGDVAALKSAAIEARVGACSKSGCASVRVEGLVEIATRCLGDKDHLCGNEDTYYPPLTSVDHARPAYTEIASYRGDGLNTTWEAAGQRSAFIGSFTR